MGVGHGIGYTGPVGTLASIRGWGRRRFLLAVGAGLGWLFLSGLPTEMFDTPLFVRMTSVRWWDYPFWVAGAVLVGLLAATYVAAPGEKIPEGVPAAVFRGGSQGEKFFGGGVLSVFAIGCPVCNKLVVLALGSGGALAYFAPLQPFLGFLSVGLLLYALRVRLRAERACPVAERADAGAGAG